MHQCTIVMLGWRFDELFAPDLEFDELLVRLLVAR